MDTVTIRRAQPQDVPTIATIWTRASEQLGRQGLDQWQYPVRIGRIEEHVAAGTCWIVEAHPGHVIGTVTVDGFADPQLWQPSDEPNSASYVHRMVLTDEARGSDLGSAILDWAATRAAADGKRWLRLDAWTTNPGLHRYYLNRGFHHVRTVEGPQIVSGVLLQRDANLVLGRGPAVLEPSLPN
jgi:GNAT superfamily N-acetyltransferase